MKGIEKEYYSPKTGFTGKNKLYERLDKKFTHQEIKDFLDDQKTYQLHKQPVKKFQNIIIDDLNEQWQADLIDLTNFGKYNKGLKWVLNVVDLFSRFAYIIALPNKQNKTVADGFEEILKTADKKPKRVQSDNGKEFKSSEWKSLLEKNGIHPIYSPQYSPWTNGAVERFNQTLKRMMFKYFTTFDTLTWFDVLQDFVENYNSSHHSSLPFNYSPQEINEDNKKKVLKHLYESKYDPSITNERKFEIGDEVRLLAEKTPFEKSYTENYTQETFTIVSYEPGQLGLFYDSYGLKNEKGEKIRKRYIYSDLIPVKANKTAKATKRITKVNRKDVVDTIAKAKKLAREEQFIEGGRMEDYYEKLEEQKIDMNRPSTRMQTKKIQEIKAPVASRTRSKK